MRYTSSLDSILADAREIRERVSGSEAREKSVEYFAKNVVHNVKVLTQKYNSYVKNERLNALIRNDDLVQDMYGNVQKDMSNLADNLRRLVVALYADESLVSSLYLDAERTNTPLWSVYGDHSILKDVNPESLPRVNGEELVKRFVRDHKYRAEESPMKQRRHTGMHAGGINLIERLGLEYITTEGDSEPRKPAKEILERDVGKYLKLAKDILGAVTRQDQNLTLTQRTSRDKKRNEVHYLWNGQKRSLLKSIKTLGVATAMCGLTGLTLFGWGSYQGLKQTEEKLKQNKSQMSDIEYSVELSEFRRSYDSWEFGTSEDIIDNLKRKRANEILKEIEQTPSLTNRYNMPKLREAANKAINWHSREISGPVLDLNSSGKIN